MQATKPTPATKRIEFDTKSTYQVGKMTAVVDCVFRPDGAKTVNTILERLIKSDVEKNC